MIEVGSSWGIPDLMTKGEDMGFISIVIIIISGCNYKTYIMHRKISLTILQKEISFFEKKGLNVIRLDFSQK
jgi:hypothetical protein